MTRALTLVVLTTFACEAPTEEDAGATKPVPIQPATTTTPCLSVSRSSIDFGEVEPNGVAVQRVDVGNHTLLPRNVRVLPRSSPFFVSPLDQIAMQLPSGGRRTVEVLFVPTDALLHLDVLDFVSEPLMPGAGVPPCHATIDVRGLGSGSVQMEPSVVDVGFVPVGETKSFDVRLSNTRRETVPILATRLESQPGAPIAFSANLPMQQFDLAPMSSMVFTINAAPPVDLSFAADLVAVTPNGPIRAQLTVVGGAPVAELTPESIEVPLATFEPGFRGERSFVERTVHLRNASTQGRSRDAALQLVDAGVVAELADGGVANEVSVTVPQMLQLGFGLELGQQIDLLVRVSPGSTGLQTYRLRFFTNDPVQPEQVVTLKLADVQTLGRCSMLVLPLGLGVDLLPTPDGRSRGEISFTNTGTTRCVVDDPSFTATTDPRFSIVDPTPGFIVEPGERRSIIIEGPRTALPISGAIGFHVLNPESERQYLSLHVAP